MSKKLSYEQRLVIAEKLMEWGNLVFAGLVIGQFLPDAAPFQLQLFLSGCLGMGVAYLGGIVMMKKRGGEGL